MALPFANPDYDLKKFQSVSDTVVLMAYDQHWGGDGQNAKSGQPGPPAGPIVWKPVLQTPTWLVSPAPRVMIRLSQTSCERAKPEASAATKVTRIVAPRILRITHQRVLGVEIRRREIEC